jgi:hypothetical protein
MGAAFPLTVMETPPSVFVRGRLARALWSAKLVPKMLANSPGEISALYLAALTTPLVKIAGAAGFSSRIRLLPVSAM